MIFLENVGSENQPTRAVDISVKIKDVSWQVLPKRWIVERSFAWLGWSRRLAKDFEQTILSAENFVKLGIFHEC